MTALPGMKQGGLCARNELHTAQAFERAHLLRQANLASYSPGQRRPRGSACRSFAGQLTTAGDVHAKVSKSSLLQLQQF